MKDLVIPLGRAPHFSSQSGAWLKKRKKATLIAHFILWFSSVMVTNNYCAFCHTLLWNYGFMGQHKVPFESYVDGLMLAMKSSMTIWQPGFKNERKEIVATLCKMHRERVKFLSFIVHTEYREGNSTLTICFCRMFVTGNIRNTRDDLMVSC